MPLFGTLKSMPLPDVLQWLGGSRKTGTLQIEFNRVFKTIHVREGQIIGCSSNDPAQRLGHFLLSRGRITEDQLREALASQERTHRHLGMTLVEMKILSADELSRHLEDKADEIIFSMFDWNEAVFRFHEVLKDEDHVFPVSLRVEDVLLRGVKRLDEMAEIRAVFNDPGIVLARTEREPPPEVFGNRMARTLYEACDGERTVAEILLHVHGSEYVVTKFLFELHRNALVRIVEIKPVPAGLPRGETSAADPGPASADSSRAAGSGNSTVPPPDAAPAPATPAVLTEPAAAAPEPSATAPDEDLLADWNPELDLPAVPQSAPPEAAATPSPPAEVEAIEGSDAHRLHSQLEAARRLMADSEFEAALEILDHLYRRFPGDESLRRLSAEAEAAFVEKAYRHYLPPAKIPALTKPVAGLDSEKLSPSEFFLLSRIDGSWDVKSIIQIAPLRESDALRTLKRMRENGVIVLRDPEKGSK